LNQTEIYLDLIHDLKLIPDCYIINSSGQIHPFLYGGACDFGLKLKTNTPVIGYTKQLLFGALKKIKDNLEIYGVYYEKLLVGYAIPKSKKKYYYISIGNNISLETAKKVFLSIDLNLISILKQSLNSFNINV